MMGNRQSLQCGDIEMRERQQDRVWTSGDLEMRDSHLTHLACASFGAGLAFALLFYVVLVH